MEKKYTPRMTGKRKKSIQVINPSIYDEKISLENA